MTAVLVRWSVASWSASVASNEMVVYVGTSECFAAPQYGTHSPLAFELDLHHILSIIFFKPAVSIRPSVPLSGSHKCLRFGIWSILCTVKYFIYLLIYLLTYITKCLMLTLMFYLSGGTVLLISKWCTVNRSALSNIVPHTPVTQSSLCSMRWGSHSRPYSRMSNICPLMLRSLYVIFVLKKLITKLHSYCIVLACKLTRAKYTNQMWYFVSFIKQLGDLGRTLLLHLQDGLVL